MKKKLNSVVSYLNLCVGILLTIFLVFPCFTYTDEVSGKTSYYNIFNYFKFDQFKAYSISILIISCFIIGIGLMYLANILLKSKLNFFKYFDVALPCLILALLICVCCVKAYLFIGISGFLLLMSLFGIFVLFF